MLTDSKRSILINFPTNADFPKTNTFLQHSTIESTTKNELDGDHTYTFSTLTTPLDTLSNTRYINHVTIPCGSNETSASSTSLFDVNKMVSLHFYDQPNNEGASKYSTNGLNNPLKSVAFQNNGKILDKFFQTKICYYLVLFGIL